MSAWAATRVASGVGLLAVYAWRLSRPEPIATGDGTRWRRLAQASAMTVVVAVGLPLLALTLMFGSGLWRLLLAGWIWVLGGGLLGLSAAVVWEIASSRLPPATQERVGRVIFWAFFVIGGVGLLFLALHLWVRFGPTA
jgi:hypothetical protein